MSVNFNSKFDGKGIQSYGRPSLNLVVSLDISGSMGSSFQGLLSVGLGLNDLSDENDKSEGKLEVAKKALLAIIGQLKVTVICYNLTALGRRFLWIDDI